MPDGSIPLESDAPDVVKGDLEIWHYYVPTDTFTRITRFVLDSCQPSLPQIERTKRLLEVSPCTANSG